VSNEVGYPMESLASIHAFRLDGVDVDQQVAMSSEWWSLDLWLPMIRFLLWPLVPYKFFWSYFLVLETAGNFQTQVFWNERLLLAVSLSHLWMPAVIIVAWGSS
jgi:hypothetical protein